VRSAVCVCSTQRWAMVRLAAAARNAAPIRKMKPAVPRISARRRARERGARTLEDVLMEPCRERYSGLPRVQGGALVHLPLRPASGAAA